MFLLAVALAVFWIFLSGKFDAFHLSLGALSVFLSLVLARRLWRLNPHLSGPHIRPIWLRWPFYLGWLAKEIVKSSFQVAYVVLHPRMPINPGILRFRTRLPHEWAQLSLAHSITLTPGTVTVDVEGDEFLVHSLTEQAAGSLYPAGDDAEAVRRVAALFGEKASK